jgi:cyclopropane-fatty-acyl-phospholipid synthase
MNLIELAERGWLPDGLIRMGIRRLLRKRLGQEAVEQPDALSQREAALREQLLSSPIAVETPTANAQHYEVPAEFFLGVLGPRLKYSCCLYATGRESLAEAEEAMLELTCERAQLSNGLDILELGCGWGSLSLWMAEHYPQSRITAVSNSRSQREFIWARAAERGLTNLTVLTADMRAFDTSERFDRVVSVEMFEHMRNYHQLLSRIAGWLRPDGKLFVHIFCHRQASYLFDTTEPDDWMGRHFFTGGIMPSDHLLLYFQHDMELRAHWRVSGIHYWRTCEDWLRRQDAQRSELLPVLCSGQEKRLAELMFQRWRMFFMACAELFRFHGGSEWFVSHYLFNRRSEG